MRQRWKEERQQAWLKVVRERVQDGRTTDSGKQWRWLGNISQQGHDRARAQPMEKENADGEMQLAVLPEEVAEVFKTHFEKLANGSDLPTEQRDRAMNATEADWKELLGNEEGTIPAIPEGEADQYEADISRMELIKAINGLKTGKACGADGISAEALKLMVERDQDGGDQLTAFGEAGLQLGNLIFNNMDEELPASLKTSLVVPIFKAGEKSQTGNYRGISLISSIYKLYMTIITKRITAACERHKLLPKTQGGFRPGREVVHQAAALAELVDRSKPMNQTLYVAFLDQSKAYDRIPLPLVAATMDVVGFGPKITALIRRCHQGVTAQVKMGQQLSGEFLKRIGLPQGTPESPGLFNIVTAPLLRAIERCGCGAPIRTAPGEPVTDRISNLATADDTAIMAATPHRLQQALKAAERWREIYCTKWNPDKSRIVAFNVHRSRQEEARGVPDNYSAILESRRHIWEYRDSSGSKVKMDDDGVPIRDQRNKTTRKLTPTGEKAKWIRKHGESAGWSIRGGKPRFRLGDQIIPTADHYVFLG